MLLHDVSHPAEVAFELRQLGFRRREPALERGQQLMLLFGRHAHRPEQGECEAGDVHAEACNRCCSVACRGEARQELVHPLPLVPREAHQLGDGSEVRLFRQRSEAEGQVVDEERHRVHVRHAGRGAEVYVAAINEARGVHLPGEVPRRSPKPEDDGACELAGL